MGIEIWMPVYGCSVMFVLLWFILRDGLSATNTNGGDYCAFMFLALCPVVNTLFSGLKIVQTVWRVIRYLVCGFSYDKVKKYLNDVFGDFFESIKVFIKY